MLQSNQTTYNVYVYQGHDINHKFSRCFNSKLITSLSLLAHRPRHVVVIPAFCHPQVKNPDLPMFSSSLQRGKRVVMAKQA